MATMYNGVWDGGGAMEITFTHTAGRRDWVHVLRDGGLPMRWAEPSFATDVPPDLVHYVVETRLGLRDGFWGLVAEGVSVGLLNQEVDRIAAGAPVGELAGHDPTELVQAECVAAGIASADLVAAGDRECLQYVRENCAKRNVALPPGLDEDTIAGLRAELSQVRHRWQSLGLGQPLVLSYSR